MSKLEQRIAGYCANCREKELELYGEVVHEVDERHKRACKEAHCKHPWAYAVIGKKVVPLDHRGRPMRDAPLRGQRFQLYGR